MVRNPVQRIVDRSLVVLGSVLLQVKLPFPGRELDDVRQFAPPRFREALQMYHQIFGEPLDRHALGALPAGLALGAVHLIEPVHDLLAHELVHAVQQLAARVGRRQRKAQIPKRIERNAGVVAGRAPKGAAQHAHEQVFDDGVLDPVFLETKKD